MDFTRFLKELARGKAGARSLSREDAHELWSALLAGAAPEAVVGAVLVALRVKSESLDELAGFLDACEADYAKLAPPPARPRVVSLPSYNGARRQANLVPLLALLCARMGCPVLVHGMTHDPQRVTSAEVFAALGIEAARDADDASRRLGADGVAFLPIARLAPAVHRLLEYRRLLGVRNSSHTLAKMLDPVAGGALRTVSVTHPEYLRQMHEFFAARRAPVLLMRGCEGEPVANPRRPPQIEWLHDGVGEVLVAAETGSVAPPAGPAAIDAATTARWTESALRGEAPVPSSLLRQLGCIAIANRMTDADSIGAAEQWVVQTLARNGVPMGKGAA